MEEARWADTATEGLGGGLGRKGYRVRPPAKGCSGGSWALCRERGSRMISSLAARRGSLTPRAGKEAGTGVKSRRVGSWNPTTPVQDKFGRLGLVARRG